MKLNIVTLLLAAVSLSSAVGQAVSPVQSQNLFTVLSCNDGDTCKLQASDSTLVKVRLVGIDAPEFKHSKKGETQPIAAESKEFINKLIVGKSVTLRKISTDIYKRELGEIFIGDTNVNIAMIKAGYAEKYQGRLPSEVDAQAYSDAEDLAKKEKKGIWSLQNYESPKTYRKRIK